MNSLLARFPCLLVLVALSLTAFCSVAVADGSGKAGDDFQTHISDYETEVAGMVTSVDGIVADYGSGADVSGRVDDLVGKWERVAFHEAVETHAMVLYPPIWVALGGLREAVDKPGADADVRAWQHRLETALHEGVGALKLAAARGDSEASAQVASLPADDRPAVEIIQDNLEQVLSRYRGGDAAAATTLVHQTYMQRFEGIEGDLIERDADLVTDLEEDFNATLPLLMEKGVSADEVSAQIDTMNTKLDKAQTLLDQAKQEHGSVF